MCSTPKPSSWPLSGGKISLETWWSGAPHTSTRQYPRVAHACRSHSPQSESLDWHHRALLPFTSSENDVCDAAGVSAPTPLSSYPSHSHSALSLFSALAAHGVFSTVFSQTVAFSLSSRTWSLLQCSSTGVFAVFSQTVAFAHGLFCCLLANSRFFADFSQMDAFAAFSRGGFSLSYRKRLLCQRSHMSNTLYTYLFHQFVSLWVCRTYLGLE